MQVKGLFEKGEMGEIPIRTQLKETDAHLRMGGTVPCPAIFVLADFSFRAAMRAMVGRVLAVGVVRMHSEGYAAPVTRASLIYSVPPAR